MIKQSILLLIFGVNYIYMGFHQDTYHIVHDKVEIAHYNHTSTKHPYITVEDFNATYPKATIRGSAYFTCGVKRNIIVNAYLYKLVGKVYRNFPINITFDICDEIKHNVLGAQIAIQHSNLHSCPCPPGDYYINDYLLEEEKFPPHLPFGKYRLVVTVFVDDVIFIGNGSWEGAIEFHQNIYHVKHNKIIIESYNHSALQNPSIVVEDFNSTFKNSTFRTYAVFKTGVKKNIMISVKLFKLVGTIYRSLPYNLVFDLCEEIKNKRKEFLVVLSHSNLRGCPAQPGIYTLKDYVLEEEKLPPHAPLGRYKIYLEVYIDDLIFIGNGTWEGELVKNSKS